MQYPSTGNSGTDVEELDGREGQPPLWTDGNEEDVNSSHCVNAAKGESLGVGVRTACQ